jgi:hypothetical protein
MLKHLNRDDSEANMSKVYVTQETEHDFTKAEAHGEIVFLTRQDLNNIKGSLHNTSVINEITAKLKNFDGREDWLVIAGSPYISTLVFLMLGARKPRELRILRWDNRDFLYVPLILDLRGVYND